MAITLDNSNHNKKYRKINNINNNKVTSTKNNKITKNISSFNVKDENKIPKVPLAKHLEDKNKINEIGDKMDYKNNTQQDFRKKNKNIFKDQFETPKNACFKKKRKS